MSAAQDFLGTTQCCSNPGPAAYGTSVMRVRDLQNARMLEGYLRGEAVHCLAASRTSVSGGLRAFDISATVLRVPQQEADLCHPVLTPPHPSVTRMTDGAGRRPAGTRADPSSR